MSDVEIRGDWDPSNPTSAVNAALLLLERQTIAIERIADRLDSWNKEDGDHGELCVRRW